MSSSLETSPTSPKNELNIIYGSGLNADSKARLAEIMRASMDNGTRETPEIRGDEDDSFVTSLRDIAERIGLEPDSKVIYPGSYTHVGVARVFGKENVMHVDPDEHAMAVLREAGYKEAATGISEYEPDQPADAIVALNSYGALQEEDVSRLLSQGGYLITNNYTNWATDAARLKELKLVGVLLPNYMDPSSEYLQGDDIPADSTDTVEERINFEKGGEVISTGDEVAKYPDGLFVFQRVE